MTSHQSDATFRAYLADSVESAMMLAKGELGEDAVLLGSRRVRENNGAPGRYEVRFAAPPCAPAAPSGDRLQREIAELRERLDGMHRSLSRSLLAPPRGTAPSPLLADLLARLLAADLDAEIAQEVVDAAHQAGATDPAAALAAARADLARRIRTDQGAGAGRVMAFTGPPGAGKTSMLVKVAMRRGLSARRSLCLISADGQRIGGAGQLRHYASILGASFQAAATPGALAQALEGQREKDLILIDTAGLAGGDEMMRFLAERPEIETHLALMSSMRSADLYRVWNVFRAYNFARLVFTRADETDALGGAFSLAARSGVPISFLSTGPSIPEDLEAAGAAQLAERILPRSAEFPAAAVA